MLLKSTFVVLFLVIGSCCVSGFDHIDKQMELPTRTVNQIGNRPIRERLGRLQNKLGLSSKAASKLKRMTWQIDGVKREALVHIPSSTSRKKLSVIFAFHGHGGSAEHASRKLAFHVSWPEAISVYPQGLPTSVPLIDREGKFAGWQKSIGDQEDRDLRFFDAMLATMKSDYSIDEDRVYASGHSNGGYFTYTLWAARGDIFAAVAPIAASVVLSEVAKLKPKPVIHVAGENDPIVRFRMQERTIEYDRKLNGCDPVGIPAGTYCTEYRSRTGTTVVAYIHQGGHEVPNGAIPKITQFFQEHPKK